MTRFCPNCDEFRQVREERRKESHSVRGETIEVDAHVLVCTVCGHTISDPARDEQVLLAVYAAYRERHGLLKPEEIRSLRERYGLSQRSLARLLGWGLITIQRYERGALQDEAHDQVLRGLRDPQVVLEWLDRYGHRLPARIRERVRQAVSGEAGAAQFERLARELERLVATGGRHNPELHGFRIFDLGRVSQLVAHFAKACPDLFKTKLAKLLWLSDFAHFRLHRVSISGMAYARLPHGPAPHHFQAVLAALEEMGTIRLVEQVAGPYVGDVVEPLQEGELDEFTDSEREIIGLVIKRYGRLPAAELSRLSHAEPAWADRVDGDLIPYTEADSIRLFDSLLGTEPPPSG